jgi:hypothetical protein
MSDELIWVIVVAAVVVVVLAVVLLLMRARRRRATERRLHERLGPEYDRTVGEADSRRERRNAEAELAERVEERDRLEIRPLSDGARERYAARWQATQAHFVEMPAPALEEAEALLAQVMEERGYPVDGFERQAALISVDHLQLVENYREAHATRDRVRQGSGDTEDMRRAMLRYRSLLDELLAPGEATPSR